MASTCSLKMISLRTSLLSSTLPQTQKQLGCNLLQSFPKQSLKFSTTQYVSKSSNSGVSAFFFNKHKEQQDSPKPSKFLCSGPFSLVNFYCLNPLVKVKKFTILLTKFDIKKKKKNK